MEYRIRYHEQQGACDKELLVEANSPAEAVIKFRATRPRQPQWRCDQTQVTSVQPEGWEQPEQCEPEPW